MEFRDDTLSFDKYEVQGDTVPQRIEGKPEEPIFYFTVESDTPATSAVSERALERGGMAVARVNSTEVAYCTIGWDESLLGQVLATGLRHSVLATRATMALSGHEAQEL